MTEQLGNLGDFFGGIGVLISIIYLAYQVRQNTRFAMAESVREVLSRSADFLEYLASNAELTEIFVRGTRDPDSLSFEQQARLGFVMSAAFRQLEAVFRYHESSILSDNDWEGISLAIKRVSQSPFVMRWWPTQSFAYSRDFQALIMSYQKSAETKVSDVVPRLL